ncbi:hypothetical protein HYH03_012265 [Edaphochlamys debaryana]|uniref:Ankyrin repeat domain-containing protein n=1 Tax=Edaphochlamys debaryana TaxID=47281 RepID=A0A835XYK8_9CHLO|nr:hypothetical protein HYH03_012265 [Edaphochlamys debaryana]|eukprot:KAG2489245.1 hypothetical protein HYH03_012265 [Edaphochlamys debaryana]
MVGNLQLAVQVAGCAQVPEALVAAAVAGQLGSCRWLSADQPLLPLRPALLAAAQAGQGEAVHWCLDNGAEWTEQAVYGAAFEGHLLLMQQLLDCQPGPSPGPGPGPGPPPLSPLAALLVGTTSGRVDPGALLLAAAEGCSLPDLQSLWAAWLPQEPGPEPGPGPVTGPASVPAAGPGPALGGHAPEPAAAGGGLQGSMLSQVLASAAASPTPDWRDKVVWLEGRGAARTGHACRRAAGRPDALARLVWLSGRGYPADDPAVASAAAGADNVEALVWALGAGAEPGRSYGTWAALDGHVGVLRVLLDRGLLASPLEAVEGAAARGQLGVLRWAAEALGEGLVRAPGGVRAAARSGSWETWVWVQERVRAAADEGGPRAGAGEGLSSELWSAASEGGCGAVLESLAEAGCPLPHDGEPYLCAARQGDLATLAVLRRLGCPWGPPPPPPPPLPGPSSPGQPAATPAPGPSGTSEGDGRASLFVRCVAAEAPLPALAWLVAEGCPVAWAAAQRAAGRREGRGGAELRAWLQAAERAHGGGGGFGAV